MNREQIIRMAREVSTRNDDRNIFFDMMIQELERFAALVAAAERDRMCEQFNISKELAYEKAKSNEAD